HQPSHEVFGRVSGLIREFRLHRREEAVLPKMTRKRQHPPPRRARTAHIGLRIMAIPRPTTILYLEDDPAVRLQLGDALRAEGFAVQEAATGAEGLRLAEARPDVVLLDLRLPDMSGIEVCRRIKAASHTAATLVLYHSAHPAPSNGQASHLAGGADGFLGK